LEYWLSVNFNSKYDGDGIKKHQRSDLNVVIALDISGSMQSQFQGDDDSNKSKLQVAKESILFLLEQLKGEDAFGLITFDTSYQVIQPLTQWKNTDIQQLKTSIQNIQIGGGTVVTQALEGAKKLFENFPEHPNSSNRIFFMTDMEVDPSDGDSFTITVKENSDESKWTTVIGIGIDLTSTIISKVSTTPGSNYANVRSTQNFNEMLQGEFGYLVTPIGFNISIELQPSDHPKSSFLFEKGYGSPEINNIKEGFKVDISTEFPSAQNENGQRRGGAMLFKLKQNPQSNNSQKVKICVKHENLQGLIETDIQELNFVEKSFEDDGIRKSIVLIRYTDFVKEYLKKRNERQQMKKKRIKSKEARSQRRIGEI